MRLDNLVQSGSRSYNFMWVALDKHVLMVKVTSEGVNHGHYIGAVKGEDYDDEAIGVPVNGSLLGDVAGEVYFHPDISVPFKFFSGKDLYDEIHRPGIEWPLKKPLAVLDIRSLDKHVISVAVGHLTLDGARHPDDKWTAYIGAVKGEDHYAEYADVLSTGSAIPLELAEVIFEDLGKATRYGHIKWEGVEEVDRSKLFIHPAKPER